MYAYLEGRRFLHGVLGFKLGRQYVTDALGWWSFDGGRGEGHAPLLLRGRRVRRARGARRDAAVDVALRGRRRLARQPHELRPVALPAVPARRHRPGVRRRHRVDRCHLAPLTPHLPARLRHRSPRRSPSSPSDLPPRPTTYDGTRISTDKLGYAVEADLARSGAALKAGFAYDLYDVKLRADLRRPRRLRDASASRSASTTTTSRPPTTPTRSGTSSPASR